MQNHEIKVLHRVEIAVDGFLVDLDGTLIDSTEAVIEHWAK